MVNTIFQKRFSYYRRAGKFDEFGKSSMIWQTKTIQISTFNEPFEDRGHMYASRE